MSTAFTSSAMLRRSARMGMAGALLVAAATGASAEEGIGGFLSSVFGGNAPVAQPAPAPRYVPNDAPGYAPRYRTSYAPSFASSIRYRRTRVQPLVVRLQHAKPRLLVAGSPTKPAKVSIYEDRTLRRGDAVMTADGVRVFAGSSSWPYTAGDFVALTKARSIDRDTSKVLAQLDRVPRD